MIVDNFCKYLHHNQEEKNILKTFSFEICTNFDVDALTQDYKNRVVLTHNIFRSINAKKINTKKINDHLANLIDNLEIFQPIKSESIVMLTVINEIFNKYNVSLFPEKLLDRLYNMLINIDESNEPWTRTLFKTIKSIKNKLDTIDILFD